MPNIPDSHWVTEVCKESGTAFSLALNQPRLAKVISPYQTIEIYDTQRFGKLMLIDGCTMVSSLENFFYHEMMTHPILFTHPNPKRVVIIGGGDCGTLKEVLKHSSIEHVTQIDIDEQVTRLSEQYFPELCESNDDPRAELLFTDGIQWMHDAPTASADIIIVDSTDPVGPAEGLFNPAFFAQCHRVLADDGLLVQQGESPLTHHEMIKAMHQAMKQGGFVNTTMMPFPQPIYPTGYWCSALASKGADFADFRYQHAQQKSFSTQYYTADIHRGCLSLPPFLRALL